MYVIDEDMKAYITIFYKQVHNFNYIRKNDVPFLHYIISYDNIIYIIITSIFNTQHAFGKKHVVYMCTSCLETNIC